MQASGVECLTVVNSIIKGYVQSDIMLFFDPRQTFHTADLGIFIRQFSILNIY